MTHKIKTPFNILYIDSVTFEFHNVKQQVTMALIHLIK